MRGLAKTVSRLTAASSAMRALDTDDGRLDELLGFGSNPGELRARTYVPDDLPPSAPLVVILHGCTQSAVVYDKGSGWSELAERHGFALLLPEQRRTNNPNLCFNWYDPADARRGQGEAKSIAQMVEHMVASHRLDPARVYVTGLSAGGAMTAVMLAAYPELFAGGAIIAGLPFAAADTLPEALERMRGQAMPTRSRLADKVAGAAPPARRRPTLSVWHGTGDAIVRSANADAIVDQWRDLYGLGSVRGEIETIDGQMREVWRDCSGQDVIEQFTVRGMGHGIPLDTRSGETCGNAGPHMLEAGICSTRHIAAFWGLSDRPVRQAKRNPSTNDARSIGRTSTVEAHHGVAAVIEKALRSAGLMA